MRSLLLPSKTRKSARRRSIRCHVEAALLTVAIFALIPVLFSVKIYKNRDDAFPPSRAYALIGDAEAMLLDMTGPETFSRPNMESGYSSLFTSFKPLAPEHLPALAVKDRDFPLAALPTPVAVDSAPQFDPILEWILLPRPDFTALRPPTVYPQVTLSDGLLLMHLFPDTETIKQMIAKTRPAAPTLLSFIPADREEMLPRIRIDASCGVPSLDQQARRAFLRAAQRVTFEHPFTATVLWRNPNTSDTARRP